MSSQHINVITVSRGGAPVVTLTIAGMHQDHHPPRPRVGNPATHSSTNAFQATPGALPNATVTRGTGTALTRAQVSGTYYYTPQITPQQPNPSIASGRSPAPLPSPTTAPSAYPPPSPRPPLPTPPPSNPPYYRASSDNNRDRADSRGFHYAEGCRQGTNGGPQADYARVFADPHVGTGTPPMVDADRRGRSLVGSENFARGVPMARRHLDAAWGVTRGTKESLGLTD
ncbi:hypothetical protein BJY52DRAFT_1302622 [Lactarius psammicola]|nr:hypothetical protein BJY52DRAFT_1302622 [Lactarius psammicola]